MILKVCKNVIKEDVEGKNSSIEHLVEYYEANSFTIKDGIAYDGQQNILIHDYKQRDDITGEFIEYDIDNVFLMNNEGKTIERLV